MAFIAVREARGKGIVEQMIEFSKAWEQDEKLRILEHEIEKF